MVYLSKGFLDNVGCPYSYQAAFWAIEETQKLLQVFLETINSLRRSLAHIFFHFLNLAAVRCLFLALYNLLAPFM
jgi:hypothetical protein